MLESRLYDRIGRGYVRKRRSDPRIAALIERALGDAESAVNVVAGAGSHEPSDRLDTPTFTGATGAGASPR